MTVIDEYLACARLARDLVADQVVVRKWQEPSALAEWSVAGLAGHLARSVLLVPGMLAAPVDDAAPSGSAVDYFVVGLSAADLSVTSPMSSMIRERGVEAAGAGPDDLVGRVDIVLADLEDDLPAIDPDRVITALGMNLTAEQYLVTRLIELTVHADDLAVSVGVPTPPFSPATADIVVAALAQIAARRHGFTTVLRGLARVERAPDAFSAF